MRRMLLVALLLMSRGSAAEAQTAAASQTTPSEIPPVEVAAGLALTRLEYGPSRLIDLGVRFRSTPAASLAIETHLTAFAPWPWLYAITLHGFLPAHAVGPASGISIRPYVVAGLGDVTGERVRFPSALVAGGGVRLRLSPRVAIEAAGRLFLKTNVRVPDATIGAAIAVGRPR